MYARLDQLRGFVDRATMRALLALAWPIAAAMAGETVIGIVDTKLVGGLGREALAGVGQGATFMYLGYIIVFGVMRGVKIRTAFAVGEGRAGDGVRYAQAGVLVSLVAGALVWLFARDVTWLLEAIGVDKELVPYARDFFAAVTYGAPATCIVQALTQHRQGMGDSRTPMIVGLAGNVVNLSLGYCLIYGKLGLPALGVSGAGYGTAVTQWLEAIAMLAILLRDMRRAAGGAGIGLRKAAREVLSLGGPTGAQFGAEMLAFVVFTSLLGSIGSSELAAHQAALATIRCSFLPGIAVGEAASVMVGQSLGRKSLEGAERATRSALVVAIGFMAACGVMFALLGGPLARAMTPDDETAGIATKLLLIAAVFQVLDAVNIVFRSALRGAKDVKVPAALGISIIWTCVPGAALLLGKLGGLGAVGGWCGFIAETVLSSVLFGHRWWRGSWRKLHAAVPAPEEPPLAEGVAAE